MSKGFGGSRRELIPETHRVCRRGDGSIYGIPAGKKCRKGAEDYTTVYRVKRLNDKKESLGKKLVEFMEKPRPDGVGNFMEHPDEKALKVVDEVGKRVKKIDQKINVLEGKNPNQKRWVDGDPYGLKKYSNFSSTARRNYEEEIKNEILAQGVPGKKAVLVVGGPGSKKMTLSEKKLAAAKGFVIVNPEAIRNLDPVMRVGKALGVRNSSAMSHGNAKRLAKEVYEAARDKGLNVVVSVSGVKADKHIEKIRDLKGRGYRVSVLAYHVNPKEGIARSISRLERLGTFIPVSHVRRAHLSIPEQIEKMSREADNAIMFDVGRGRNIVQYQAGAMVGPLSQDLQGFRREFGSPGQQQTAPIPVTTT